MNYKDYDINTLAIHGGVAEDQYGSLITPIYESAIYKFDTAQQGGQRFAGEETGFIYSRLGNPTVNQVEDRLAILENAEAGLAFSTGMGAISSLFWTVLSAGDHVVTDKMLYGCTFAMLDKGMTRFGVEISYVNTSDPREVEAALRPNTKVVYLETPANPTLKIVDLEAVAAVAHGYNPKILVFADNTFATPVLTRPLDLGCDAVVHSATKYINGHGDLLGGFLAGSRELVDRVRGTGLKDLTGAVMDAFQAFLIGRGMKTLPLRMKRHCGNAEIVARFLEASPYIETIFYPGLASHPGHEVAKKQMQGGFGSIIAFELKGGKEAAIRLCNSVELIKRAVSLGDCETLIEHPASMTHSTMNAQELARADLSEGLMRFSIGLEDPEDIIRDLERALELSQK